VTTAPALPFADDAEWLETDGLGGYASGTVGGLRTRRYHALLLAAATPPTGRTVLVNGCEAWVETGQGQVALSQQRYAPDVVHPDGRTRLVGFALEPWPTWTFALPDGGRVVQEVLVARGLPAVVLRWRRALPPDAGAGPCVLAVRPLFSGRDYHALHHENPGFAFDPRPVGPRDLVWRPYPGVPAVLSRADAAYHHDPVWYRRFLYTEERARGLDCVEDLASPGVLRFDLAAGEASWLLVACEPEAGASSALPSVEQAAALAVPALVDAEARRRRQATSRLGRAVDAYVVRGGRGTTIVAGYPWFTDWGRDTFIALRGLLLATGRLDEARDILRAWAGTVSQGMMPNRFPDRGEEPEYNAVDAALWYAVAVRELVAAAARTQVGLPRPELATLYAAVDAILTGYSAGTRYGIRVDDDGLLAAGVPGVQLTWMDAKVGDWVVTPRIGKPVEIQALWVNALAAASAVTPRWREAHLRARASFTLRFWNDDLGGLFDVVDVDHVPNTVDASVRPNQILAVGGLPEPLLEGPRARRLVDLVEARLLAPLGLRSLAPGEPRYVGRYDGAPRERDAVYHQGAVWPWLLGPFVEAWVRVRGGTRAVKDEARARFLGPVLRHLDQAGLGHVSEITDGDPPYTPRGCPFQAWSLGEALRIDREILR
jgi:predicted glycogen debranching enzyme